MTWTDLLEGFETTIQALPKILARNKTPLEIALKKTMDASGRKVMDYYNNKVNERLGKLNNRAKNALNLENNIKKQIIQKPKKAIIPGANCGHRRLDRNNIAGSYTTSRSYQPD